MLECPVTPQVQRRASARSRYRQMPKTTQAASGLYRLQTHTMPAAHLLGVPNLRDKDLPLCSFGPGGSYLVDWYPNRYRPESSVEEADAPAPASPADSSLALTPLALLGAEIRDWLMGIHPGRIHRHEAHPECFIPCGHCGTVDTWRPWRKKLSAPERRSWSSPTVLPVDHRVHLPSTAQPAALETPGINPLTAHLSEVSVDQCNPQTTGSASGVADFSQNAWLFANHAGTRRPASPFQGHRFRARGSTRTKKTVAARTAQGSLFER